MTGLLAIVAALSPVRAASAGDPLTTGATLVGLGGAFSVTHQVEGLDTIHGLQLLPHVGYVISDRFGTGSLRGALEIMLEPTLMHLMSEGRSSTSVGASALGRWILGESRVRPYVEAGLGMLLGRGDLQHSDCSVNFLLQAGPGLLVVLSDTTTLAAGYRFQHVSNASACDMNIGLNSSALYLGVSYRFR
jgi:hypothetical protein